MLACLYWIRDVDHTDVHTEGYVGVTKRLPKRLWEHRHGSGNPKLTNAMTKHETIVEILVVDEEEKCYNLEAKFRPTKDIGWNLIEGGGRPPSPLGRKQTEAHKRNVSLAKKGKLLGPQSEETKRKKSVAIRQAYAEGRHRGNGGHGWPKGRPKPHGTGAKISKALTGRKLPPEQVQRMSLARKGQPGRKWTSEQRLAASKARKGRSVSSETRQKLSIATTRYWERQRGAA